MYDEELHVVIEINLKVICQEFSEIIAISEKTIPLHLHQIEKSLKIAKIKLI